MSINTIETGQVLQSKLDEKAVTGLTSGWMDANAGDVEYNGGKEVKIPEVSTTGLKDYDRDEGYNMGSVSMSYKTYSMEMDRGTSFQLDAMDVNESNFVANAARVTGEFQRAHVLPEIDAYRYSKLAAYAAEKHTTFYIPNTSTLFKMLKNDIAIVQDIVGESTPLIISINTLIKAMLEEHEGFRKQIDVADFNAGIIKTKVKMLDNAVLMPVPSARMKTSFVFADGKTDGQTNGGFKAGETAQSINWIIMPQKLPKAVTKQDKMKIFDPDTYQKADAWFIGYRRYHDLWVKAGQLEQMRANVEG